MYKENEHIKFYGSLVAIVLVMGALLIGAWSLWRWINYSLGYEAQVRDTVCEMVKPEYLKQPCDKK